MIKVSDYIIKFLESEGVGHIFTLPGGMCMHITESLSKSAAIKYIGCLHEQGAAFMAESYARVSNNLGVAVTTCGPAATNTITAIAGAWIESTPLLVITGQVKRADLNRYEGLRQFGVQEVDIKSIVSPITKYATVVENPEAIKYELEKALWHARSGRKGPVLLDIPVDVQGCFIDESNLTSYIPDKNPLPAIQDKDIDLLIKLLKEAKRPVIYAGAGIRMADAAEYFYKLLDITGIPVVLNWNGMDLLSDDNPLYMGRPGGVGQRAANLIVQACDLLIVMGTRLSILQTGFNYEGFAKNAKVVMVDIDQAEMDKPNLSVDLKINADLKDFISKLLEHELPGNDYSKWVGLCREWNNRFPNGKTQNNQPGVINSFEFVGCLSEKMNNDSIFIGGRAGTCVDAVIQGFKVKEGQRVVTTKGLSSMGNGLPAAIGACYYYGKPIISVIGDGGFVMNIQELEVITRDQLPVKFFILDNSGYSTVRNTQKNVFNGHLVGCDKGSGLTLGHLKKIIEGYGIETIELKSPEKMNDTIEYVLSHDGPIGCIVTIDPDQPIEPRQASYKKPDGQMASRPLEDMKPLLPEGKIAEIMNEALNLE